MASNGFFVNWANQRAVLSIGIHICQIRARYFENSYCFFFCFLANQDGAFYGRFGPPFSSVPAASFAVQQKDGGKKSVL